MWRWTCQSTKLQIWAQLPEKSGFFPITLKITFTPYFLLFHLSRLQVLSILIYFLLPLSQHY